MHTRAPIRPLIIREKSYTLHLVSALAILLLAKCIIPIAGVKAAAEGSPATEGSEP